ncbi:hypothetical protein PINS_up020437 [Pythium insidiosum]|nr:hypothetical protein PINS_up020437 [Pythium insidiosum]
MSHYVSSEEGTAQTLRLTDGVRDSVRAALTMFLDQVNCVESTHGVYVEMHGEHGTAVVWQDAIMASVLLLTTAMRAACGPLVDELWAYENGVAAAQRQVQQLEEDIEDERLNVQIARQQAQMLVFLNHQLTTRIESLTRSAEAGPTEETHVHDIADADADADADANVNVNVNAGVAVAVAGDSVGDDDPSVRVILEYIEAAMERDRVDGRASRERCRHGGGFSADDDRV